MLGTDLVVLTSSSFSTLSWQLEDTADWRAAGGSAALPDFSASGAPIHFGYRFGLGTSCSSTFGCTGASSNVGVDNLRIDVVPTATDPGTPGTVPEPPALALLGLAASRCGPQPPALLNTVNTPVSSADGPPKCGPPRPAQLT